jgi:hypothetical protein
VAELPHGGRAETPDSKPNLEGPVPKAADGHPDLTGIWDYARPAPPPRDASLGLGPVAPGSNAFFNIGIGMKDGLPFQPWALALRKSRMAENNKDNPDAHCLPIGLIDAAPLASAAAKDGPDSGAGGDSL